MEKTVSRTVFIDNKLKKIYKEFDSYQELDEATQNFFDQIFNILWIQETMNLKNSYLAERFGYSESTIQKKLKRLEEVNLITRQINRSQEPTGVWITTRIVSLDPFIKAEISSKLKLLPKGLEVVETVNTSEEVIKKEEVIVILEKKNNGKPAKFRFGR